MLRLELIVGAIEQFFRKDETKVDSGGRSAAAILIWYGLLFLGVFTSERLFQFSRFSPWGDVVFTIYLAIIQAICVFRSRSKYTLYFFTFLPASGLVFLLISMFIDDHRVILLLLAELIFINYVYVKYTNRLIDGKHKFINFLILYVILFSVTLGSDYFHCSLFHCKGPGPFPSF